jgi:hypothetical protein
VKVVQINAAEIKPYWRNPRDNDAAVEAVKASIQRYGFNSPLVVDTKYVILAGHTRFKALTQLGVTKIPCVVLDIDDAKAREYRIADNKTSEFASWDLSKLIPELREIGDPKDMEIYFPEYDLKTLLEQTAGQAMAPVTQEAIDAETDRANAEMSGRGAALSARVVDVTCPHCNETFGVNRELLAGAAP